MLRRQRSETEIDVMVLALIAFEPDFAGRHKQLGDRIDDLLRNPTADRGAAGRSAETLDALGNAALGSRRRVSPPPIGSLTGSSPAAPSPGGPAVYVDELRDELLQVLNSARDSRRQRWPALGSYLVVGVNGTGKTTTVGKLAKLMARQRRATFGLCGRYLSRCRCRAAELYGPSGPTVEVIKAADGADPASVVFDALQAGRARGLDVVLVDTAGRLHTRVNLMAELEKIHRVASHAKLKARLTRCCWYLTRPWVRTVWPRPDSSSSTPPSPGLC